MAQKTVVRLELTKDAKSTLTAVSKRTGMTQVAVGSRLYEWFAQQTEMVQAVVLNQIPQEIGPNVADLILSRPKAGKRR